MATGESAVWAETDLNSEITYLLMISVHSYLRKVKAERVKVESTHKVPTSHYHTKHCHAAVVPLGGLTHREDNLLAY